MSLKALLERLDDKMHVPATYPAAPAPFAPKVSAAKSWERLERERQPHSRKNNETIGAIGAVGAGCSAEIDFAAFGERAAIMEYDGGLTRAEADFSVILRDTGTMFVEGAKPNHRTRITVCRRVYNRCMVNPITRIRHSIGVERDGLLTAVGCSNFRPSSSGLVIGRGERRPYFQNRIYSCKRGKRNCDFKPR